jgi:AcrR family transcriptional regulator
MGMSDLAERTGISIGSLYQYFPDKSAVVRTLAGRIHVESRACIRESLAGVSDLDGLRRAFAALVDTYYGLFLASPVMRDIWSATQADQALRDRELEDSRADAALLSELLTEMNPQADPHRIAASAFLVMLLGEATMRLAVSVDRGEGDLLVEAYKRMALDELCRAAGCA